MVRMSPERRWPMVAKTGLSLALTATLIPLIFGSAVAVGETNVNFVLGEKRLDAADWPIGDDQLSLSLLSTFGPRAWPVQMAADLLVSGAGSRSTIYSGPGMAIQGNELIQSTVELDLGVRKIWRTGRARPFAGGGLAVIAAQQEFNLFPPAPFGIEGNRLDRFPPIEVSDDDEAPGVWIDGGVFWRLGRRCNIGIEARYSRAEVRLRSRDVQAGGFNLGLLLGWGWGGGARIVP